ncbi:MAG: purine-nucleoside phosphorylase [Actinomycetota bacterium]|nr:purine-nucleoside phosphorylase [Actinomycetota bacterium]MDQ3721429.1 purine-nucleoside phosphorylase [Actinomycetota bacterium]
MPPRAVRAVHLRPSAELAERVLLPGDPHRALFVAQALLERPIMFNHRRGLWGYTGAAPDGKPVTVQSTGMGGPSAAIVTEELIALGARRLVRIGTCGALDSSLAMGELLAAEDALAADGASRALGAEGRVPADPELTGALAHAGAPAVTVVSTDLFFEPRVRAEEGWRAAGASAVEMEAATVLQVAHLRGARAACALAVTDVPGRGDEAERLDDDGLAALGVRLGELGLAALGAA